MRVSPAAPIARCDFSFSQTIAYAALFCVAAVLCLAPPRARAQMHPASPGSAHQQGTVSGAGNPVPPAASEFSKSSGNGNHEGIQIFGRWVIEVRNPDGTVTARREFENSIQQNGMAFLASLVGGTSSPGGLSVLLNGSQANFQVSSSQNLVSPAFFQPGPCLPLHGPNGVIAGPTTGTSCLITTGLTTNNFVSSLGNFCLLAQAVGGNTPAAGQTYPCSTNLSVTAPAAFSGQTPTSMQVQLNGNVTVTATNPGMVTDVETVFTTCVPTVATGNCTEAFPNSGSGEGKGYLPSGVGIFTERNLDGNTTLGDPQPVSYTPGQIINVSVTLSFQ